MNKYCEDTSLPTVANQLAEMIVEYETKNKIPIKDDCDFEVDDEIVTEEEFLYHIIFYVNVILCLTFHTSIVLNCWLC